MKKFHMNSGVIVSIVSLALTLTGPTAVFAGGPAAVNLRSAGNYVILAKTGISTTGTSSIVGDIGISPAAATYITGFGLALSATGPFSTSTLVTGNVYAPGYADPAPANLTSAVLDMQTAYADAAARSYPSLDLVGGNIGGLTLGAGLYKWSTDVTMSTDLTLQGGPNDVWIFQIAGNLTMGSNTHIVLTRGAQPANIFWQVAGQTTLGTSSVFNGNILDQTAIVLGTGAMVNGRLLAQTAVTLDSNVVIKPAMTAESSSSNPNPSAPGYGTPSSAPSSPGTPSYPTPTISPSIVPASPPTLVEAMLLRKARDPKVYVKNPDGTLRWIKTAAEFVAAGYTWANIKEISAGDFAAMRITGQVRVVMGISSLRVRMSQSASSAIMGRVLSGQVLQFSDLKNGWYQIKNPNGTQGWISARYAQEI